MSLLTPPLHHVHHESSHSVRAAELLRCNDPLLDIELAAFKHDITAWQSVLDELKPKISRVQALLDALIATRTSVKARLKDAQFLLRPICRMPNEILTQIFHGCIPQFPAATKEYNALDSNTVPWTLTRVCRRWRNLARSLPRLWSYVKVDCRRQRRITLVKAKTFVDLSKDVPIFVDINCKEGLNALQGSEHRWKFLRSKLDTEACHLLEGTSFPSLETLDLSHTIASTEIFNARTAPNLRMVKGSSDFLRHSELPWTQFTELILCGSFEPPAAPLIERMTSLERVKMITASVEFTVPVKLPRVSYLSLFQPVDVGTGSIKNLLEHMILPMLSSLRIIFESDPEVPHDSYYPNRLHSPFHLTTLHIYVEISSPVTNTELLLDFLSLTPRVKEFKISNSYLTESFVLGMTCATGRPCRLPEMTSLDMGWTGVLEITPWADGSPTEVICRMIESRMARKGDVNACQLPGAVLQEVYMPRWAYRDAAIWSSDRWCAIRSAMKLFCTVLHNDIDSD